MPIGKDEAVSCPIALFPATSKREKISFHRINKNTGHRIKYQKIDAVVESPKIIKGYQVGKCEYPEIEPKSWKRSRSRANVRST